jgi:hypothetical protein
MLRGLPLSNELGWWFTHSGNSSPGSSSSGTSYAWGSCWSVQVCSSGTANCDSSCDPVWCNCISNHVDGASEAVECYDDMICRWAHWTDRMNYRQHLLQGSLHHPRTCATKQVIYFILGSIKFSHKWCYTLPNPNTLTYQVTPAR